MTDTFKATGPVLSDTTMYQGYKNYETFLVATDIENSHNILTYWQSWVTAQKFPAHAIFTGQETVKFALADKLKMSIRDDRNPLENSSTVYTSLLAAALEKVDWAEVAEQILNDMPAYQALTPSTR